MFRLPDFGSFVCTQGSVMNRPPSYGQHFRIGNWLRSKPSLRMTSLHGASFRAHRLGKGAGQRSQLRQHLELVKQALGGLHVHQALDAVGDFIETIDAEGKGHATLAAELVDEDAVAGMAFDVFEEQSGTAGSIVACGQKA